jgi:homoserine kinase type II
MHRAGGGFRLKRPNALSIGGWPPLLAAAEARADEVAPGLAAEAAKALAELQRDWPSGLDEGVIHADLFPDNVFFLGEKLSGLIDFYFACNDALVYDLAVCLNAWCFEPDASFNITKGMALIGEYEKVRRLDASEVEALPILARGAALRFMLTRLVDWLNVPQGAKVVPKDPLEYLKKMRFHAGVRSAREYGLFR